MRESGIWLGAMIFSAMEHGGLDYGVILTDGLPLFLLALFVTAIGLGTGCWWIAQMTIAIRLRMRMVRERTLQG